MTWFKVDDGLHSHRKVKSLPRRQRTAALGLWVLAGSWSAANLTDGHIPEYMVEELGGTGRQAADLCAAGLWMEVDGGFMFHGWAEPGRQPTRAEVEESREHERKRKADWRARQRGRPSADSRPTLGRPSDLDSPIHSGEHDGDAGADPSDPWSSWGPRSEVPVSQRDSAGTDGGTDGGTPASVPASVRTPRPDPTRPVLGSSTGSQSTNGHSAPRQSDRLDLQRLATILHSDEPWAQRVATQVLDRAPADVRNPTAYVEHAIREHIEDYRPTLTPPKIGDLCWHGRPATTCPDCRAAAASWA